MKPTWTRLFIGFVAVLVVGGLIIWSRASSRGTITANQPPATNSQALGKTLDGKHFELSYPSGYSTRILPAKDNDIELYELRAATVYDKRLAVLITHLPNGVLTNDGSYNLRKVHPEDYQERTISSPAGKAHIMMKTNHKEQTVFITRGNMLATLAFVTDGADDQLTDEVNEVVAKFRWKS